MSSFFFIFSPYFLHCLKNTAKNWKNGNKMKKKSYLCQALLCFLVYSSILLTHILTCSKHFLLHWDLENCQKKLSFFSSFFSQKNFNVVSCNLLQSCWCVQGNHLPLNNLLLTFLIVALQISGFAQYFFIHLFFLSHQ